MTVSLYDGLERRLSLLETNEEMRKLAHDELMALGHALGREMAELRTSIGSGLGTLGARIDELCGEIDTEVREKLDSITSEVEDTASHMLDQIEHEANKRQRLAIVVGKLKRERSERVAAERHSIRVQSEASAELANAAAEIKRTKRFARRAIAAAVLAAAGVIGAAAAGALVNHCGVPAPAQHEAKP